MTARRPKRKTRAALPRLVVVGVGRMGGAIALGHLKAGGSVSVVPHSPSSARRATALGLPIAGRPELRRAELCFLVVPDSRVEEAAAEMAHQLGRTTALGHCAGALKLEALGTPRALGGRPQASFHPLCGVAAPTDSLAGASVALAASTPRVMGKLRALAAALEMNPFEVPERQRALYHAGAVLGAGALTALAASSAEALTRAGVPPEEALRALLPLMRSSLRNVEAHGIPGGMTGPVVRGDVETVRRHLGALPKALLPVYGTLMLRALEEVQARLAPGAVRELRRMLRTASLTERG